jgi:tRNA pseudouridine38-40 synthase
MLSGPQAAPQPPPGGLVRLRLDLSYDGSQFHGWARQPGLRTVQQVVEEALGRVLGVPPLPGPACPGPPFPGPAFPVPACPGPVCPALTVAGRTDAGVHARGQVVHADVPAPAWQAVGHSAGRRLARVLPPDVRVRAIAVAPDGFDARFSALWRRYSYRVCDDPAAQDPLRRYDTLWYPRPVEVARMNDAAVACLGEHDFAAFCRKREGATTVRELLRLDWERAPGGVAVASVVADAFCHNMVRALVGALLAVGDGRRSPAWLAGILAAGTRDPAVVVVAPHGLCLEEVCYPPAAGLAARAVATRRVR